MMRQIRVILGTTLVAWLASSSGASVAKDDRPSVVVILADDLGYGDLGVQGAKDLQTPHLDALAASGVRLVDGYAPHPFCSPARAGLLTGRYQHRFGYERNIAYDPQNLVMGLPIDQTTVATRLQKVGYATMAIGKWHVGAGIPFHPTRRGFDHFYGFLGGGHDYFSVDLLRPMGEGYRVPLQRDGRPEVIDGYLTDRLTDAAVSFLETSVDQPTFLYLAYNAPHTPMQAPDELMDRFASIKNRKRRTYAAMVAAIDNGVGRILETLEKTGRRESTLVVFLSDNGGPESSNGSDNGPLRGMKGSVSEGGIRVPFLLSWPGTLPSGVVDDRPIIGQDVTITAMALADLDVGTLPDLAGVNLMPYLTGEQIDDPHEALFWRSGPKWAVRAGDLKLVQDSSEGAPKLYDLRADVGETTDLASGRPSDVARLQDLYDAWNAQNRDPFFPGYRQYHPLMDQYYDEISTPK